MSEYRHDDWCESVETSPWHGEGDGSCTCWVRIVEERDAKIERKEEKNKKQAEVITKLEASRAGLKKENKLLRLKPSTPEVRRHFPTSRTIANAIYARPFEALLVLPLALIHGDLQPRLWRFVYGD